MVTPVHRILLVDDDLDEQFLTNVALKAVLAPGSVVRVVNSGEEAVKYMIGEGKYTDRQAYPFPTLVITDLKMPHGDGFDVLEFLQANPSWSVVPRILLSSSNDDDDVRTAYFLGASAYVVKPVMAEDVEKQLRLLLAFWGSVKVPPVDETGRLLTMARRGGAGARFPYPAAGERMRRPEPPTNPAAP